MPASRQTACLDEPTAVALVGDGLDSKARRRADAHLAECSSCGELVARVASALQSAETTRPQLNLPQPGQLLSEKYRVERVLGRGGMGTVFAARHVGLGHLVAIKVLHLDSEDAVPRFMRCLEKQPARRFASIEALGAALQAYVAQPNAQITMSSPMLIEPRSTLNVVQGSRRYVI